MFPIGFMYYFGTNLDSRFAVPDFWPRPEATYKIPFERDEIDAELEHQRTKRLLRKREKLEQDSALGSLQGSLGQRGAQAGQLPWWLPGDLRKRMEAQRGRDAQGGQS